MYYGLGQLGIALAMGIAAVGSAIGIGIAGQASIGAWKKCYMSNKAAPFILTPCSYWVWQSPPASLWRSLQYSRARLVLLVPMRWLKPERASLSTLLL